MVVRNRNTRFIVLGFSLLFGICLYLNHRHRQNRTEHQYNVIVWWSPYRKHIDYHRKCDLAECRFTSDRSVQSDPHFTGYLFYGRETSLKDLPVRKPRDLWAIYHEGSPKETPYLLEAIDLFNFSATISRHSDVPLTLQSFTSLEELIDYHAMYSFEEKVQFQRKLKMAPVLYLQSRCDTLTGRELYVKELAKHISIDSYGSCLHNKSLPDGILIEPKTALDIKNYFDFVSMYKFVIVYQDMVCEDYIIDKFWKALSLGIVPIYFGAPNIRKYLPNPDSAILIDDFKSPAEMAKFIIKIANDKDLYNSFLSHKILNMLPISNQLLVETVFKDDIYFVRNRRTRTIAEFECHVCAEAAIGRKWPQVPENSSISRYRCTLPSFPPGNVTSKALPRMDKFLERTHMEANFVRQLIN
ncbi:alpha-(1,3)-fucosyltransferase 10 [Uranotaenia lowii]|uniref:alpha-(1,3)-fucosyltransferase 10 n=1 Tax=Uranotaenia lowii TaxID=190385 RepID=UPI002479B360|nr:alpha-(1,3)-fucosyltransferase 10 [Uranotaenia lowii]